MKPNALFKAFLLFPGTEKKWNVAMQAQGCELDAKLEHSAGSGTDNSAQPWASPLEIHFLYMSITLRMHLSPRAVCDIWTLALELPACPPFQRQSTASTSLPPHLQNRDNTTHFRISYRPIFAKHFENERCCLSTERWPQNLQAVFLKHFMPFHIKASYLQAQPASAVG